MNILLLAPLRYVAALPFVVSTIQQVANNGHRIDVIVSNKLNPGLTIKSKNIRIVQYNDSIKEKGLKYIYFVQKALQTVRKWKYDIIIGLSPVGLIAAAYISKRYSVPYIYYNDEISYGDERHTMLGNMFGYTIKCLERIANKRALFTVTQDSLRGRHVAELNRIPMESLRFLPNSKLGKAKCRNSNYAHNRFGFQCNDKIILWMGSAAPRGGALELALNATKWPKGWRMLFHLRCNTKMPYIREILKCHKQGAVYVSSELLSHEDADELVNSASIGLGFYPNDGINHRCIGASSGKINHQLKNGIPCVVGNLEGLKWIEENKAGICVDDTIQVFEAAKKILKDYDGYRLRAVETFEKHLSFDRAFKPILKEMREKADNRLHNNES